MLPAHVVPHPTSNLGFWVPANPAPARRFVISDVHGCYRTLEKLVSKLKLQPHDQLFFLGDYIHKGPSGQKVLDFIFFLQQNGHHIYPLKGNHEQLYLSAEAYGKNITAEDWADPNLLQNGWLKPQIRAFFGRLPCFYELPDCWLVHGGFDFSLANPLAGRPSMLNIRNFSYDAKSLRGKPVIHGHHPHDLADIEMCIRQREKIVPLDNGCAYYHKRYPYQGTLLALDLNRWELIEQVNEEEEKPRK